MKTFILYKVVNDPHHDVSLLNVLNYVLVL
jgi:hypothetical protein